ncbi:MAG: hypothetical protein JJE03_06240 [Peptostreptococcaceae bacterium]|nr:hypothetical protein [Peptostreptococcaceae bacterium]
MKRELKIIVANPSGNITIFVMTPCNKSDYQKITNALLSLTNYEAEQVAFVLEGHPASVDGAINMSGMEFCGNASRSYGLLLANNNNKTEFNIAISGAKEPVKATADPVTGFAKVNMPLPKSISAYPKYDGTLVDMDGIVHLVVDISKYSPDSFESIRDGYYKDNNPPAFGVMYYNYKENFMTPVVYVRDVNTVYHEGSCGSGTVALAVSLSKANNYADSLYNIEQPSGSIESAVHMADGKPTSVTIGGPVSLSKEIILNINIESDL